MIIVFDTCIIIDYLLNRDEFINDAESLIELVFQEKIIGLLTSKSIADIHYILKHQLHDEVKVRQILSELLNFFQILETSAEAVLSALKSDVKDYEDALLIETADLFLVDGIVTRNTKDFKKSKVTVYSPKELISLLNKKI